MKATFTPLTNAQLSEASWEGTLSISGRNESAYISYDILAHLELFYPAFRKWFFHKVVKGCADGSRAILTTTDQFSGKISGITILKKTPEERKICTLYVLPQFSSRGFGTELLRRATTWLDHPRPIITVGASRVQSFAPLFAKVGFEATFKVDDLYIAGESEYVFNDFAGVHFQGSSSKIHRGIAVVGAVGEEDLSFTDAVEHVRGTPAVMRLALGQLDC